MNIYILNFIFRTHGFNQYIQQVDINNGQFVLNGRLNSFGGVSVYDTGVFTGAGYEPDYVTTLLRWAVNLVDERSMKP